MEKPNRKITWVHVTYTANGKIYVVFVTERWRDKNYLGKRKREFIITRDRWTKLNCLLRVLSRSVNVKHSIFAWDGYSVCFERFFS